MRWFAQFLVEDLCQVFGGRCGVFGVGLVERSEFVEAPRDSRCFKSGG